MSREDMHPRPRSPYAASKLSAEYYCTVWTELGKVPTISLRYFNVFGPGQSADSKYAAVFPAFISALLDGRSPIIHWDGEQSRDFTFIDDVVEANLLAADLEGPVDGSVINVAGGTPRSINEVFYSIRDEIGGVIEATRVAKREGDIRNSFADPSRARELLGWTPRVPWQEAVRRTVAWFRAQT